LVAFRQLLELKPEWHATYGQIAHLGTQYKVEEEVKKAGEEAMHLLITDIQKDLFSIPLRVSLAVFSKLRTYRSIVEEINKDEKLVKKLADVISMSALEGLDQFYEAFVSFTSMFSYKHSSICIGIIESMPEMIAIPPKQIERRQWISACEALANSAITAKKENKQNLVNILIESSLSFADEMIKEEQLSSYEVGRLAKVYNIAEKPALALKVIKKIPQNEVNCWLLYEQVKSYLAIGDSNLATSIANKCLNLAKRDAHALTRISIFHDQLSDCYVRSNNLDAAADELKLAIKNCEDDKYLGELVCKLGEIEAQLKNTI